MCVERKSNGGYSEYLDHCQGHLWCHINTLLKAVDRLGFLSLFQKRPSLLLIRFPPPVKPTKTKARRLGALKKKKKKKKKKSALLSSLFLGGRFGGQIAAIEYHDRLDVVLFQ